MADWEVEYTDEFEAWWAGLTGEEQESVAAYVELLEKRGPQLHHPYSSGVLDSRHGHMRECGFNMRGDPIECCTLSTHGASPSF